ncbi:unnamed protein product, partial [Didymodactylos carnosus]
MITTSDPDISNECGAMTTKIIAKTTTSSYFQHTSSDKSLNALLRNFSLICLNKDVKAIKRRLQNVTNDLEIFMNPFECVSYIVKAREKELIIIVSQPLTEHFIPLIHDLIQVIYIYILHTNKSFDDEFTSNKRYSKIRGSFMGHDIIISKLIDDLHLLSNLPLRQPFTQTDTSINFYMTSEQGYSLRTLTKEQTHFVSFQLLIDVILSKSETDCLFDKTNALKLYQVLSIDDQTILDNIHEFEQTCSADDVIDFFLTNNYIKETLNKSLRTENIQQI